MTGGKTTQTSSYTSGVNFAPKVSGYGSIVNGDITTGDSSGNQTGSAGGASVSADLSLPGMGGKKVMLVNLGTIMDRIYGSDNTIGHGNFNTIVGNKSTILDGHFNTVVGSNTNVLNGNGNTVIGNRDNLYNTKGAVVLGSNVSIQRVPLAILV